MSQDQLKKEEKAPVQITVDQDLESLGAYSEDNTTNKLFGGDNQLSSKLSSRHLNTIVCIITTVEL